MRIKTKLIINMVISAVAVWSIVVTSIFGMTFIKGKLAYLTQKSTPFQLRTIEFQKELQGTITDLIKVNASRDIKEYKTFRDEAEKSLSSIKVSQQALEEMTNTKLETYDALTKISQELFEAEANKLNSETAAAEASRKVSQQLKESSARLKELDKRIRIMQTGRNNSFATALRETGQFSGKLRSVEQLRNLIKDLQIIMLEIQSAQKSAAVLIAKGRLNSISSKIAKNSYQLENDQVAADCKTIVAKIEEFAKLQNVALSQKSDDSREKVLTAGRETAEKVNALFLTLEQDANLANEKFGIESGKQGTIFNQSNIANNILSVNSELVSLGMSLEGLSTKLFTIERITELDKLSSEISVVFGKMNELIKNLNSSLTKAGVKDELRFLAGVQNSLATIRSELFASLGIIATLKTHLVATEETVRISEKLHQLIISQTEKGKESVSAARGDQEKAIASVNRMVTTNTTLLISIGLVAAIIGTFFGVWGFRSVITPLHHLISVAECVADGNLQTNLTNKSKDEFGQVQVSMDKMVDNLRDMIGRISNSTETIASSSHELATTAEKLEQNFDSQARGIDQTVTAMTEMSRTIQEVSGHAISTSESAGHMKQIAVQGRHALDSTSSELLDFAEIVRQSAEKTETLGSKSEAINSIVALIKDIADQTNLLALNASIEAARAGDMGLGFAVVAESVRQLAQRIIESSEEISRTVKDMHDEVEASIQIMGKERAAIEAIINSNNTTLSSMGDIVNHVEEVFGMVQSIASATEEQSATTDNVNRTMIGINDVTRHLTLSVNEIKGTSDNFARLASNLQQMVGWFKL